MSEEQELPQGWVWTTLREVTAPTRISIQPDKSPTLPYIGMEHIESETMKLLGMGLAMELKSNASYFMSGDVLYGRMRPYLNKVYRPEFEGMCSPEFLVFRDFPHLNGRYLQYFLNSWMFKEFASHLVEGDRPRVDWDQLKVFNFPLPPLPEQQRIVDAIEAQFTLLDASIASLQQDRIKLKNACTSVLKYAVEGKLTEEWRAEHTVEEDAQELLACILRERRAKWEAAQLAKMQAKGVTPKDDAWKKAYKEPVEPDTAVLGELPEGWCWARVEQVSYSVKYGSSAKTSDNSHGVPVLRMGNIQDGEIDFSNLKYLPKNHNEFPELLLRKGDLLFNRTNSAELVGKSAVYKGNFELCSYASYIICLRTLTGCLTNYLCYFLNSSYGKQWASSVLTQQAGQANVNGTKLQALVFPLPPFVEQQQIISDIEMRLSLIEQAEKTIEESLLRAERVRQSILRQAFSGQLVPQVADDEPAGVLLERIREARERRMIEEQAQRKEGRMQRSERSKGKKRTTTSITDQDISLVPVLVAARQPLEPEVVFKRARLEQDDVSHVEVFFEVLGEEEEAGYIRELPEKSIVGASPVLLEATPLAYAMVAAQAEMQDDRDDKAEEIEREE